MLARQQIWGWILLVFVAVSCTSQPQFPKATRDQAPTLPAYPQQEQITVRTEKGNTPIDVQFITFITSDTPNEVLAFYEIALKQQGWSDIVSDQQTMLSAAERQACPLFALYMSVQSLANGSTQVELRLVPSVCLAM